METPTPIDFEKLYEGVTPEAIGGDPKEQILKHLNDRIFYLEDQLKILSAELKKRKVGNQSNEKENLEEELKKPTKTKSIIKDLIEKHSSLIEIVEGLEIKATDRENDYIGFIGKKENNSCVYGLFSPDNMRISDPVKVDESFDTLNEFKFLSQDGLTLTYGIKTGRQLLIDQYSPEKGGSNKEIIRFRNYYLQTQKVKNDLIIFLDGSFRGLKSSIKNSKVRVDYITEDISKNPKEMKELMKIKPNEDSKGREIHLDNEVNGKILENFVKNKTTRKLIDSVNFNI